MKSVTIVSDSATLADGYSTALFVMGFEKAMEFLGTSKEDTVIFEDALYAVRTAKKAGFFVTGIFDEQEPEQEEFRALCDVFVYNLKDSLKNLL